MSLLDQIQPLDELELENQRIFLRADLDCPTDKAGKIIDDYRIVLAAQTIKKLQSLGARVIVASRFGDTKKSRSKNAPRENAPSIEPAAARLSELLECDVLLPDACVGESVKKVVMDVRTTQVCVLENLARENDLGSGAEAFARLLQDYVDVYVADALRPMEQESATTVQLPRLMEFRGASPNLMRELQALARIRSGIDPPRFIIWGGNSLSGRLELLERLVDATTQVHLVGVAANTMIRALGGSVGTSAIEESYLAGARSLAERLGDRLHVPQDVVVSDSPRALASDVKDARELRSNEMALDIGPRTRKTIHEMAEAAETVIWCGTAGFHKSETFSAGTRAICNALAETSAFTLVAGEDSVAAVNEVGRDAIASIDCIAQGGSASLALLNETKLTGLEALRGTTTENE